MIAALLLFLINQSVTLPLIKGTIPRCDLDSVHVSYYLRGDSVIVDRVKCDRGYIDTLFSDSAQVTALMGTRLDYTVIKTDSLHLPLWANHPATATVGTFGLDTLGADTLWIKMQNSWLVVAHD